MNDQNQPFQPFKVLWDATIASANRSCMGGKGANLYHLTQAGLPVPPWVCIPSGQFPQDIHNPELSSELLAELNTWLKPSQFYAVRSSALAEDGGQHSWAGQFKTWLYVPAAQVPETIVKCWQAITDAHLCVYAAMADHIPQTMAVIVQQMVNSAVSGVLFTANPVGDLSELVIVAGYGLGEGIVSDQVETDQYVYQRWERSWQEHICCKTQQMLQDLESGQGLIKTPVSEERHKQPALTREQCRLLLDCGERLRQLYGNEQDIEWALTAEGQLYVLQSRPITTLPQGQRLLFDNSNVVESYPGLTLPLTFSYIQGAYARLFLQAVQALGVTPQHINEQRVIFHHMLGYLKGRVYYNLTHWYAMFRLLPGTEKYIAVWQDMMGIQATEKSSEHPVSQGLWVQWWRVGWRLWWFWLTLTPAMKRFHSRCAASYQHFSQKNKSRWHHGDLYREYCQLEAELFPGWEITLFNDAFAFVFTALVKQVLKRLQPGHETHWFNDMMCGDTALASAQPVRQLVALAETVRANPDLQKWLTQLNAETLSAWLAKPANHIGFAQALQRYLDHYGDRSWAELKLETLTLREDPAQLIRLLLQYAESDLTVAQMTQHEAEIKQRAFRAVYRAFGWNKVGYGVFRWLLYQARRSIRYRESSRLERARIFGMVRTLARHAGALLVRDKVLTAPQDVFYLTMEELWGYVHGSSPHRSLAPLVAQRQQEWQTYESESLADRVLCQGIPALNNLPLKSIEPIEQSQTLTGTPCSAGVICGRICVVRDPVQATDVQGQILVAEMTDPGWVFLMVAAAGLIVEKGSMLSHTAIIGRELGIPTIVGVKGAMARLITGMEVELNGITGEIRIL